MTADKKKEKDEKKILRSKWKSYNKYSCGICKEFHSLSNKAAVEEHIKEEHQ